MSIAATGLEVSVEKMRFKTTAGADVTDDVRQALMRIVRACMRAACMRWPNVQRTLQVPDLHTMFAQTEVR